MENRNNGKHAGNSEGLSPQMIPKKTFTSVTKHESYGAHRLRKGLLEGINDYLRELQGLQCSRDLVKPLWDSLEDVYFHGVLT